MIGKGFGKRFEAFLMKEGWMVGTFLTKKGLGMLESPLRRKGLGMMECSKICNNYKDAKHKAYTKTEVIALVK